MLYKFCFLFLMVFSGCSLQPPLPECITLNKIAHIPDFRTNEYQAIVLDYLKHKKSSDYRYIFSEFDKTDDEVYMYLQFINRDECFKVRMLIDKWDKLEGFKKVNGKSYPKEFVNLQWTLIKSESDHLVKYVDMNTIID